MTADRSAPLSLTLGVRPARGLVLVPEIGDIPWLRTFEAALASQLRFWGGAQNIVLPYTEEIGQNPLFWQLLDRADPDQMLVYTGSVMEAEELAPQWFEAEGRRQEEALSGSPATTRTFGRTGEGFRSPKWTCRRRCARKSAAALRPCRSE